MKVIKFNMDLRLNPQDEHVVHCPAFLPYSEENLEYAKEKSVDGNVTIEELKESEPHPTAGDRITELEEALAMLLSGVTE